MVVNMVIMLTGEFERVGWYVGMLLFLWAAVIEIVVDFFANLSEFLC